MNKVKSKNRLFVRAIITVLLIIAIIYIARLIIGKTKKNRDVSSENKKNSYSSTQITNRYSGKMISEEEIRANTENDKKIEELIHELTMTDDMISYEYGIEPYNSEEEENISEKEMEEKRKIASERYYQEREEILMKLRELIK